ncbi:6-phosphofructokinase [Strongyloides ratti]|uniref:ATP-dependent 6-phosphofructokinase n=1 Tax=Strongyloides ratti TaxID=34506 RepID=A0A090LRP6_STRRB|nr:6-phosphofructokinase [Strongyloides ratti]CEF70236.1 6-phosphofructokinase [Strongyloides ratti]
MFTSKGNKLFHRDSIVPTMGHEGTTIIPNKYRGRGLAVFTSGGDAPGMNAAVRSVVRMGLHLGCKVYLIHEGYQGMVDGGDNIKLATYDSVSDIIQKGGTIIGSARCMEFKTIEGRLKACYNLIKRRITNLVCIGGDGSLTGANTFRVEWPDLVKQLLDSEKITKDEAAACSMIQICGMVGTIDNDFAKTDMTIGADTALHRIIEATDCVTSTAQSHQRAFVIEVMGRHCGYLALVASLASEADFCFIPEWPQPINWPEILCKKLAQAREMGQRLNLIIVAEGAIDREGKPISSETVQKVIKNTLKYDTRITVLGHVQRGGNASAFDRLLGSRMGAEAVLALMEMTSESEPCVISIEGNQIVRVPLMKCVKKTQNVQQAMNNLDFDLAVELRGPSFKRNVDTYRMLTKLHIPREKDNLSEGKVFNVAVMNIGAPAGGMNAAVRAFVRSALYHHCNVYGIEDSFEGFSSGILRKMDWGDVNNWVMVGGSILGTQKQLPNKYFDKIHETMKKYNIHGLLMIGGFEAYHSAIEFEKARDKYPYFRIPIVVVPATISNNVPGTSMTIGSDTALNTICEMIDKIKQSANGTKKRVFVIETMGGYCGYLATLTALASGADNAYIYEERFTVDDIKEDCEVIKQKMEHGVKRYLVVKSEKASKNYNTDFVMAVFNEEGKGVFSTRVNILGHCQQGGNPSVFDRNLGTKFGVKALEYIMEQSKKTINLETDERFATTKESCALLGIRNRTIEFTPVTDLIEETDFEHRVPNEQWWLKLRPLLRILTSHSSGYVSEAIVDIKDNVNN